MGKALARQRGLRRKITGVNEEREHRPQETPGRIRPPAEWENGESAVVAFAQDGEVLYEAPAK
ncbi:MAG: hypothetical protein NTW86_28225 [Candidatus Sumerlaeota bacterium]|nr:hypothetical protein [Candidatus Sumerlaeota bacterium]